MIALKENLTYFGSYGGVDGRPAELGAAVSFGHLVLDVRSFDR